MSELFSEDRVIVVGVGLIGGSVGAALRARFPNLRVTGIGQSPDRLQRACDQGILTDFQTELTADLLSKRCVVVLCTPVHIIQKQLADLPEICGSDVLVTDGGSVKAQIAQVVQQDIRLSQLFVGAHPIAGGEKSGFEHSKADLFQDRICVLTPVDNPPALVARARTFWEAIGCRCTILPPEEHDRILAMTSHLPHVVAALMASVVRPESLVYAGTGFLDTTRIAAGNADLWTSILQGNTGHIINAVMKFEEAAKSLRESLQDGRFEDVTRFLDAAAETRRSLGDV